MRHHSGTLLRIHGYLDEVVAHIGRHAIKLCELVVDEKIIGQQQSPIIRCVTPNDVIEEQIQRNPQIGDDFRCESGK